MDSFLEANRVVESSLNKLGGCRELPLRKALLVSNAMNRAQEVAESAQFSLMSGPAGTARKSSRLLASMQSVEDTAVSLLEADAAGHHRPSLCRPKPISPMALAAQSSPAAKEQEDEVMEFISNSVLSDILSESDSDMETTTTAAMVSPLSPPPSKAWTVPLIDVTNSKGWPSWGKPWPAAEQPRDVSPPLSPGKRHHAIAFPGEEENDQNDNVQQDEIKRLKLSTLDTSNSNIFNSLPGFCQYLSPRTLCTAPLITYMLGKGFNVPSNPHESDWPSFGTSSLSNETNYRNVSPSKFFPVLAY